MRFFLLLMACSIAGFANAQNGYQKHIELQWKDVPKKLQIRGQDQPKKVLHLKNGANLEKNGYNPSYAVTVPLNSDGRAQVTIENPTYTEIDNRDFVDRESLDAGIEVEHTIGYLKRQPILEAHFVPVRQNPATGQLEKLVSADINVTVTPGRQKRNSVNRQFNESSVLKSGQWYKVSVQESKVHKMSYRFLKDLGMQVDNLNPRNIRIYGNGGGMLPEANSEPRDNGLKQNAIKVVGEADGSFDEGDYVLFYGESPHEWSFNPSIDRFSHQTNIYSNKNYYFITADLGPGERISQQSTNASANVSVTTFDDYAFHEKEENNIIASGRQWFGEVFDNISSTNSVSFNFPNLVTSQPVYIESAVVGQSKRPNPGNEFVLNESGKTILNQPTSNQGIVYTAPQGDRVVNNTTYTANDGNLNFTYTMQAGSPAAQGWLDYISVNVRRELVLAQDQMLFRDKNSVGAGNVAQFVLQGASSNTLVWDVTDPTEVHRQGGELSGGAFRFTASSESLHQYVAFNDNISFSEPQDEGTVQNQNIHGTIGQPDMVIVTTEDLKGPSETLANHHRIEDKLSVKVVEVGNIYNEFSSGAQDLTAIRDMMKMIYDRAGSDTSKMPRYLVLFGDASYDFKDRLAGNTNLIPSYESVNSLDPIGTFVTDDYFAFLDDNEGGNVIKGGLFLDVAIGRIPVTNAQDGQMFVDKIKHYRSQESFGNWRNMVTFVADDEDRNLHIRDANGLTKLVEKNFPTYNIDKIFFDAFDQVSTPGGSRYPGVRDAINQKMFSGSLIMNYTGHGGVNGWADERVLTVDDINSWDNYDKLTCLVTATCEFSKYDDPAFVSAGEQTLLNKDGGTIALVTTVRIVFASANEKINRSFLQEVFQEYKGRMPTLGEAVMRSKNSSLVGSNKNNRKFTLLGDPAMQLAYPDKKVVTKNVQNHSVSSSNSDTLKALSKVTITGEVLNDANQLMTDFNGIVFPVVFDKPQEIQTLANDQDSRKRSFQVQNNALYKGKASVNNGKFSFTFVVPKDISFDFGNGKISYYADNNNIDANGFSDDIVIGGTADSVEKDDTGPEVNLFMNNTDFAFGGITDRDPLLLVKLRDENGINTVGTGIGHDITAVLDGDTKNTIELNEFYEAELDNFKKGEVRYPLSELEEGRHKVRVKAWDVHNNSGEGLTEFIVASSEKLALEHVLNYPNPFTTSTKFQFEHNKPGQKLFVQVRIFTVTGSLVKTIERNIVTEGFRVKNIHWNGLDEFGDKIGKGVYIYQVNVNAEDGTSAKEFEKLVILR